MLSGLLCGERGKRWSVLLLAREEAKKENVLSHLDWSVLLLAREEAKRGREWLARPFMLPGEVTQAEWHQSFSMDEICKFETPTAKTIPALNNDLKFFLLQLKNFLPPLFAVYYILKYLSFLSYSTWKILKMLYLKW